MRYVIMANGASRRWRNYLGKPKHLVEVDHGESLLARTVRLVSSQDADAEIIISAHDERYAVPGATLYTPQLYELEIDRFPLELIDRPCCFLYGDAYYTPEAIARVCLEPASGPMIFFGDDQRILALRAHEPQVMHQLVSELRQRVVDGEIPDCKGWQLYHRFEGMPLEGRAIAEDYVLISDGTTDFNTPEEYLAFMKLREG